MRLSHARAEMDISGHAARSGETRARMLEAAIEVFGSVGYAAASTRILAERAGASLTAISYHFGGKRDLYLAAAQVIADFGRERMAPVIAHLQDESRGTPAARIEEALSRFFHLIVATEPDAWAAFFIRCELEADEAFRIISDGVLTGFEQALTQTVAALIGCDGTDEMLRARITFVLSAIIGIRTLRNMTLNRLGWDRLDPRRLEQLDRIVRQLARSEFLFGPTA